MKRVLHGAAMWIAALWWASLCTLGFYVVPLLFAHLPSPAIAGHMAAKLFTAQTWVTVVCGLLLLLNDRENKAPALDERPLDATVFIMLGVLLALLIEFAVAPRILARDNLRWWHSIGTGLYALQWLCAGVVFARLQRRSRAST
jgi:hypothetical protein